MPRQRNLGYPYMDVVLCVFIKKHTVMEHYISLYGHFLWNQIMSNLENDFKKLFSHFLKKVFRQFVVVANLIEKVEV